MFLFWPRIPGVPKHMKRFESLLTFDSHIRLYLSIFRYAKLKNVGLLFKFKKRSYLLGHPVCMKIEKLHIAGELCPMNESSTKLHL